MQKPLISIVIPSYNKVRFIGKTLDSIVNQDCSNVEVIIMDGGSTDGTLNVIKKYADKYPEIIRYESKKDKGQWNALNKGFRKARGKVLGFINADDIYLPGALSEVEKAYRLNVDALWFAGRGNVIDAKGKEIANFATQYKNLLLSLNTRYLLLITNYLMQPSVFFTKDAFKKYGPFIGSGRVVIEYDFWLKLAKDSMPIVYDSYISSFRVSEGNVSSTSFENLLSEDTKIVEKYTKNVLLLFLHKLNNLARIWTIKYLNQ